MIIYPAIDLRNGRVVRLREGDPAQQTVYSDDPLTIARQWIDGGAEWLHMVNLDGAFAQANDNLRILERAARLGAAVQFGGGLRSEDDIAAALEAGAARVVLGTVAVENHDLVRSAVERWGTEHICVALDARNGRVATRGWQQVTELTPIDLGQQITALGVVHALYTDVSRDGSLQGANLEATIALGRSTDLKVIASGGLTTADEIRALAASGHVAGAVIGTALYEGRLSLAEALLAARGE